MLTIISGTLLGMLGGFILGKMNLERYLSDWVKAAQQQSDIHSENWEMEKIPFFKEYSSTRRTNGGVFRQQLREPDGPRNPPGLTSRMGSLFCRDKTCPTGQSKSHTSHS